MHSKDGTLSPQTPYRHWYTRKHEGFAKYIVIVLLLLLVGILVGAVNAVAGGGTLVAFPVLVALGLPPIVADATGKLSALPGQITSIIGYRSFFRGIPLRTYILILPAVLGSLAGAALLQDSVGTEFNAIVPYLVLAAVVIFAIQPLLAKHIARAHTHRAALVLPVLSLALLCLSVYAGYFGAGFGFVLLSLLGFANLPDIHHMNALKNVINTFSIAASLVLLLSGDLINLHTGLIMAIGNGIGGYFAARLAPRISTTTLRVCIICFGLLTALYFFWGA